jgi:hypothetical protein
VQGGGRRAVLTYTKMYVRTSASFASEMACKTKYPHEKGIVVVTGEHYEIHRYYLK